MVQGRVARRAGDKLCGVIVNSITNFGFHSNSNKNPWEVFIKKADMIRFTFYFLILARSMKNRLEAGKIGYGQTIEISQESDYGALS